MSPTPGQPETPAPTTAHKAALAPDNPEQSIVERRSSPRVPFALQASLIPLGSTELLTCRTDNVSECGIHMTTPIGYGLGVGQRCEVLLGAPDAPNGCQAPPAGEGHYATVIRTEMHVGEGDNPHGDDYMGVSLHFDEPLVL